MRRPVLVLGRRTGDAQRAVMLNRLGIGEEAPPEPAPREPLFNYHPPRSVPPPAAPTPPVIEQPRLYEAPPSQDPPQLEPPPALQVVVTAQPAPVPQVAPAPPAPANDAPVDALLQEMRAELEDMRRQVQDMPRPPVRRRARRLDVVKVVRLVIWAAACVVAVYVAFNMMKNPQGATPKEDHILAAVAGPQP